MFNDYKDLLDGYRGEFDMYWSDFGSLEAVNILEKFDQQDWQMLITSLSDQSENWLIACAETLSEIEVSNFIFDTLKILMDINSLPIKIAAIDTINSILERQIPIPISLQERVKSNIKALNVSSEILFKSISSKL